MDRPCHKLLPSPRLAHDEHRGQGGRHLPHRLVHLPHPNAASHDQAEGGLDRDPLSKLLHLLPQRPVLQGLRHEVQEPLRIDGLREIVVGAQLHRLDGALDAPVGREEDHLRLREVSLGGFQDLQSPGPDHTQVGDHQVEPPVLEPSERLLTAGRRHDLVARLLEDLGERLADVALVVDDEDATGHHLSSRRLPDPPDGSRMIIVVPLPRWLSTSMLPSCPWTIR